MNHTISWGAPGTPEHEARRLRSGTVVHEYTTLDLAQREVDRRNRVAESKGVPWRYWVTQRAASPSGTTSQMNTLRDAKPEPGDVVIIGKAQVRCTVVRVGSLEVSATMPNGCRVAIPLESIAFDLERASQRQSPATEKEGMRKFSLGQRVIVGACDDNTGQRHQLIADVAGYVYRIRTDGTAWVRLDMRTTANVYPFPESDHRGRDVVATPADCRADRRRPEERRTTEAKPGGTP